MGAPSYNNFRNLITFSRGSNATLFDSTGRLTYGPNNLLTYSQQFENAAWSKNAVTVSADSVVAPDGTTTADTITENSTTDLHVVFATLLSVPTNTAVIFSVYLRANTRNFAMLRIGGGGFTTGPAIKANLTGSGSTSTIEGPVTSSSITAVGGGWYRVSMIFTTISSAPVPNIGPHDNGSSTTYAGNGTGSVYAWGAQFEVVTYQTTPSTYVATTASAYYGPRLDYDPVTLALRGMLVEEQRINLALYSERFDDAFWVKTRAVVTSNATTAPDGTLSADKLAVDTTAATTHRLNGQTTLSAISYTLSLYAKKSELNYLILQINTIANSLTWFDLNAGTVSTLGSGVTAAISSVGNGWYRCSITGTSTAGTADAVIYPAETNGVSTTTVANGTSGIFIWGAQLEAGSFATSYIPTGASSVTRNADNATMSGSQFTPWYNGTQGTIVVDAVAPNTNNNRLVSFSGGPNPRLFDIFTNITPTRFTYFTLVSTALYDILPNTGVGAVRLSIVYSSAGMASTKGGSAPTTNTTIDASTVGSQTTRVELGAWNNSGQLNGWLRSITYYPRRLSNTQLQRLTA